MKIILIKIYLLFLVGEFKTALLKFDTTANNDFSETNHSFQLIIQSNDSYYNGAKIHLNIEDNVKYINVYAIKSNGHSQPFEDYKRAFFFNGFFSNIQTNQTFNIAAIGTLSKETNQISIVLFGNDFYITPYLPNNNQVNKFFPINENTDNQADDNFHAIYPLPQSNLFPYFSFFNRISRRNTKEDHNTCSVKVTILNDLYLMLHRNISLVIQFLNYLFFIINNIFMRHKWTPSGYSNNSVHLIDYSIEPCAVYVDIDNRFQLKGDNLREIINQLSNIEFCLSLILTNTQLVRSDQVILGLTEWRGIFKKYNAAISSFNYCDNIWELYCILSVLHEIGHSFGSTHDDDSIECLPKENGSYIMDFPFMRRLGRNNFEFSPCSIKNIYITIASQKGKFTPASKFPSISCNSWNIFC